MITASEVVSDKLLMSVIEQLKLPILHIARQAELNAKTKTNNYESIADTANMAIQLIDSYILSTADANNLTIEPISIASVLQTAAANLDKLASLYNCDLELKLNGKFRPVMSDRVRLEAAFTMLGYSFIEAQSTSTKHPKGKVFLSTYKSKNGVSAGIFSPNIELSRNALARGVAVTGGVRQAMPDVTQSTGAGVFIAESLFDSMSSKLRVAHFNKLSGLAVTLFPSKQLELIT